MPIRLSRELESEQEGFSSCVPRDGTFDNALECDRAISGTPPYVQNSTRVGGTADYGAVVAHHCVPGHTIDGTVTGSSTFETPCGELGFTSPSDVQLMGHFELAPVVRYVAPAPVAATVSCFSRLQCRPSQGPRRARASCLSEQNYTKKTPPTPTATTLQRKGKRSWLRSAPQCRATVPCPHRLALRSTTSTT